MKRLPVRLSWMLAAGVALAACSPVPVDRAGTAFQDDRLDTTSYAAADLTTLAVTHTIELSSPDADLLVADVLGGAATDIVVRDGSRVRALSADASPLAEFTLTAGAFTLALAADVDEDGKSDLVFGASRDSAARLLVTRADGSAIRDVAFFPMFEAATRPAAVRAGVITFTAVSRVHVAPKIIGAYDVMRDELLFETHVATAPTHASRSADGSLIAVSSFAVERERRADTIPVPYDRPHDRNAFLVLDASGEEHAYAAVGPQVVDGVPVDGAASEVDARFISLSGMSEPMVLFVEQRMSDLYPGPTAIGLRSAAGDVTARFEGSPGSIASVGYFSRGGELRVAAAFDTVGRIVVLDESLEVIHEAMLPGASHDAVLESIGDFDGDGEIEYLVRSGPALFVLSERLESEAALVLPAHVHDARAFAAPDGSVRFAALSDRLTIVGPSEERRSALVVRAEPAGAVVEVDDEVVSRGADPVRLNRAPGRVTVRARLGTIEDETEVNLEPGELRELTFQLPDPPERAAPAPSRIDYGRLALDRTVDVSALPGAPTVGNFLALPGNELLFFDAATGRVTVLSSELTLVGEFALTNQDPVRYAFADADGDGLDDVVLATSGAPVRFTAHRADGSRILGRRFFYGNDVAAFAYPIVRFADVVLAVVATGFLRGPDMIYGLNPEDFSTEFAYPIPGRGANLMEHDGLLYLSQYTFSNGHVVVYPDGTEARDTDLFLNVMTPDGTKHPSARPLGTSPAHGNSRFFRLDADEDGTAEIYVAIATDPSYYRGPSFIYRFQPDGTLVEVWRGPDDTDIVPIPVESPAGSSLVVYAGPTTAYHLDDALTTARRIDLAGPARAGFTDHDVDGVPEFVRIDGMQLIVESLRGETLAVLPLPSAEVRWVTVSDLDADGVPEVIVRCGDELLVFRVR